MFILSEDTVCKLIIRRYDEGTSSLLCCIVLEDEMCVSFQEGNLKATILGLRFSPGATGQRNITFDYNGFTETLLVSLIPGLPASLALVDVPQPNMVS